MSDIVIVGRVRDSLGQEATTASNATLQVPSPSDTWGTGSNHALLRGARLLWAYGGSSDSGVSDPDNDPYDLARQRSVLTTTLSSQFAAAGPRERIQALQDIAEIALWPAENTSAVSNCTTDCAQWGACGSPVSTFEIQEVERLIPITDVNTAEMTVIETDRGGNALVRMNASVEVWTTLWNRCSCSQNRTGVACDRSLSEVESQQALTSDLLTQLQADAKLLDPSEQGDMAQALSALRTLAADCGRLTTASRLMIADILGTTLISASGNGGFSTNLTGLFWDIRNQTEACAFNDTSSLPIRDGEGLYDTFVKSNDSSKTPGNSNTAFASVACDSSTTRSLPGGTVVCSETSSKAVLSCLNMRPTFTLDSDDQASAISWDTAIEVCVLDGATVSPVDCPCGVPSDFRTVLGLDLATALTTARSTSSTAATSTATVTSTLLFLGTDAQDAAVTQSQDSGSITFDTRRRLTSSALQYDPSAATDTSSSQVTKSVLVRTSDLLAKMFLSRGEPFMQGATTGYTAPSTLMGDGMVGSAGFAPTLSFNVTLPMSSIGTNETEFATTIRGSGSSVLWESHNSGIWTTSSTYADSGAGFSMWEASPEAYRYEWASQAYGFASAVAGMAVYPDTLSNAQRLALLSGLHSPTQNYDGRSEQAISIWRLRLRTCFSNSTTAAAEAGLDATAKNNVNSSCPYTAWAVTSSFTCLRFSPFRRRFDQGDASQCGIYQTLQADTYIPEEGNAESAESAYFVSCRCVGTPMGVAIGVSKAAVSTDAPVVPSRRRELVWWGLRLDAYNAIGLYICAVLILFCVFSLMGAWETERLRRKRAFLELLERDEREIGVAMRALKELDKLDSDEKWRADGKLYGHTDGAPALRPAAPPERAPAPEGGYGYAGRDDIPAFPDEFALPGLPEEDADDLEAPPAGELAQSERQAVDGGLPLDGSFNAAGGGFGMPPAPPQNEWPEPQGPYGDTAVFSTAYQPAYEEEDGVFAEGCLPPVPSNTCPVTSPCVESKDNEDSQGDTPSHHRTPSSSLLTRATQVRKAPYKLRLPPLQARSSKKAVSSSSEREDTARLIEEQPTFAPGSVTETTEDLTGPAFLLVDSLRAQSADAKKEAQAIKKEHTPPRSTREKPSTRLEGPEVLDAQRQSPGSTFTLNPQAIATGAENKSRSSPMEAKEENRSPGATTDHILLKQPPERREEGVVDHGSRAAAATAGDEWGHTSSSAAHGSNRTGPDAPPEDLQFNRSRHASVVDVPPEELEGIWTPGVTQQEPLPAHGHTGGLVPGDEGDEVPEEVDEEAWLASHGGAESLALQEVLQGWGVRRRGSVGDAQMLTQKEILAAVKEIKEEREEKQRHEDTLCCLFVCPPRWWDPSLFRWLLKEFHSVACLFNDSVAYPWTRMNKTAFFWWLVWLHMGVAALLYFPYDSENEFNKHDAVMSSRIEVAQSDPCRSDTYRFQCPMEEGEWSGRDIILILWAAAAATFVSKILVFFGFWLPLPFDEMSRALHLTPEEKEDEYIRLFLVPLSAKSHVRARELALGFFWVLTGAIFLGVFGFSFFATSVFNPWMKIAFVWPSDATYSDIQYSIERYGLLVEKDQRTPIRRSGYPYASDGRPDPASAGVPRLLWATALLSLGFQLVIWEPLLFVVMRIVAYSFPKTRKWRFDFSIWALIRGAYLRHWCLRRVCCCPGFDKQSERHSWCCCSKRRAGLRIWRLTGVMPGSPEEAEMFRQRKVKRAAREKECGERCQQFLCCTRCRQDKASSASSVRTGGRGGRRWPWRRGRGRGQPSTLVEVRPASPDRQRSAQPDFETEMEEGRRLASGTNQQPGNAWAAEESRVAESEGGGVLERSEMNAQGMSRQETAWEREQFRRENQNADDQELRGETAAEKAGGTAEGEEEEGAGDVEERYGEVMGQLEQIAAALKAPAPPVRPPPQP